MSDNKQESLSETKELIKEEQEDYKIFQDINKSLGTKGIMKMLQTKYTEISIIEPTKISGELDEKDFEVIGEIPDYLSPNITCYSTTVPYELKMLYREKNNQLVAVVGYHKVKAQMVLTQKKNVVFFHPKLSLIRVNSIKQFNNDGHCNVM